MAISLERKEIRGLTVGLSATIIGCTIACMVTIMSAYYGLKNENDEYKWKVEQIEKRLDKIEGYKRE